MDGWSLGVDVGGPLTAVVARGPDGEFRDAKTLTTARDPLAGLRNAVAAVGLEWSAISSIVHGTTLVTNSLVEQKFARVALLTTQGFEDVLLIARASRDHLYRLDLPARAPPVTPRHLIGGVAERIEASGTVLLELSEQEILRALAFVEAKRPEAVAISLLHAYVNPVHEARLAAALRKVVPFVSVSHEVSPEAREYERTTTTVLNAAVMPKASAYLDRLRAEIPPGTTIRLFHSAGGMASPEVLRSRPLALAVSGPAAGASATADVCRTLGIRQGVSFDMGGTTTDVCLVLDGAAEIASNGKLGGRPIRQPMVAVHSVGAGGGSLVRLAPGGLSVGPESAGSDPGPASYGRGGTEPTVADVNVALGYLNPDRLLGGTVRICQARASAALQPIATALGRSLENTALGVLNVANAVMARALRQVTVQRGVDLRSATLIAFGGAGPMHAVSLARQVGIGQVVVPEFSGGFSAFGCITAPMLMARQKTVRLDSQHWHGARFAAEQQDLASEAISALTRSGVREGVRVRTTAVVRYVGQSVGVEVPIAAMTDVETIEREFRSVHERHYGYATDEPFLIESLRVEAVAPSALPTGTEKRRRRDVAHSRPVPVKVRSCLFDEGGRVDTPSYDRDGLAADAIVAGPCIVQDAWSTTVVPPGAHCRADAAGRLLIEVGA